LSRISASGPAALGERRDPARLAERSVVDRPTRVCVGRLLIALPLTSQELAFG
jgi:hypothetical protein